MNSINSSAVSEFPRSGVSFVAPFHRVVGHYHKLALIDDAIREFCWLLSGDFFLTWALDGIDVAHEEFVAGHEVAPVVTWTMDDWDEPTPAPTVNLSDSVLSIMHDAAAMYYFSTEAIRDYCIYSREFTINCQLKNISNERVHRSRPSEKYNYLRDLPIYRTHMATLQPTLLSRTSEAMTRFLVDGGAIARFYITLDYVMTHCQQNNTVTPDEVEHCQSVINAQDNIGLRAVRSCVLGPVRQRDDLDGGRAKKPMFTRRRAAA